MHPQCLSRGCDINVLVTFSYSSSPDAEVSLSTKMQVKLCNRILIYLHNIPPNFLNSLIFIKFEAGNVVLLLLPA